MELLLKLLELSNDFQEKNYDFFMVLWQTKDKPIKNNNAQRNRKIGKSENCMEILRKIHDLFMNCEVVRFEFSWKLFTRWHRKSIVHCSRVFRVFFGAILHWFGYLSCYYYCYCFSCRIKNSIKLKNLEFGLIQLVFPIRKVYHQNGKQKILEI